MTRQNALLDLVTIIGMILIGVSSYGVYLFLELTIRFVLANIGVITSAIGSGFIVLIVGLATYHLYNVVRIQLRMRKAFEGADDFEVRKEAYREYLQEEQRDPRERERELETVGDRR